MVREDLTEAMIEVEKSRSIMIDGVAGEEKPGHQPLSYFHLGALRYLLGTPGASEDHLRSTIRVITLLVTDSKTRLKQVTDFLSVVQPSFHVPGSLHTSSPPFSP